MKTKILFMTLVFMIGSFAFTGCGGSGSKTGTPNDNGIIQVTNITISSAGGATAITTSGGTLQLTATVLPSNATNSDVLWSSSASTVAAVNATGLVQAYTNGSATITATSKANS